MKLYFDVCCLNRPFDDQAQTRIRLESEATLSIMERAELYRWTIFGSDIIDFEIAKNPDQDRRDKVANLASITNAHIEIDQWITHRAEELSSHGFKTIDALHLACAERKGASVLLTTDDDFLRKAIKNANILKLKVANPIRWLAEETL